MECELLSGFWEAASSNSAQMEGIRETSTGARFDLKLPESVAGEFGEAPISYKFS